VVAAPYSDWSILPLKEKIGSNEGESKLYLQYTRVQADVFVHYAISNKVTKDPPAKLQLLREMKGFGVTASNAAPNKQDHWHLGVMVCGPLSERTEAQWDNFSVDYTKASHS
jgi:regulation of enolase protein 1 (concanavalin A-like superfamily)